MIPPGFPPKSTVNGYFYAWKHDGTFDETNRVLRENICVKEGHNRMPSASIIDSQTSKTASFSESTGYDGAKKTKGRKRHIAVDVLGLLLAVIVHSAAIDERSGAKLLMPRIMLCSPTILKVWADGGHTENTQQNWFLSVCRCILEIVKRPCKKFQIVKWRWIVDRSFGWLNWHRQLSKDYEYYEHSAEAWIKLAFINVIIHRLQPG